MITTIRVRNIGPKLARIRRELQPGTATWRRILFAVGRVVLKLVHEAFLVKSKGGTDESGLSWPALAESTLERKRRMKRASLDILEELGKLVHSLIPPTANSTGPSNRTDQVFKIEGNAVVVGTDREWAWTHMKGIPGRLPQRRLWPEPSKWPESWWRMIVEAAKMEVVKAIIRILQGQ